MKSIYLSVILTLCLNFCFSQSNDEIAGKAGCDYFSIKNTDKYLDADSINFIMSKNNNDVPYILFIQGSGNCSIISSYQNNYYSMLSSLVPDSLMGKYKFVLISRQGVPLCSSFESNSINETETRGDYTKFIKNNYLEGYVNSAKQVIKYIKQKNRKAQIIVIGHSQGYHIASKLAGEIPDEISKVVCMSSNPFGGEPFIKIREIRQKMILQKITELNANKMIDSISSAYKLSCKYGVLDIPENAPLDYYYYRNDYSFGSVNSFDDLMKINNPVLIVYGTDDKNNFAVLDNDLLPLYFTKEGKTNLTVQCYPGFDHNYFSKEYDDKGNVLKELFNWPMVFARIDEWIEKN